MRLPPAQGEINPEQSKVHISAQVFLLCDGVPHPSCSVPWEEIHESMLCKSGNFFARSFLKTVEEDVKKLKSGEVDEVLRSS